MEDSFFDCAEAADVRLVPDDDDLRAVVRFLLLAAVVADERFRGAGISSSSLSSEASESESSDRPSMPVMLSSMVADALLLAEVLAEVECDKGAAVDAFKERLGWLKWNVGKVSTSSCLTETAGRSAPVIKRCGSMG